MRSYTGAMTALWWSVCQVCSQRIEVGQTQVIVSLPGVGQRWVHEACAREDVGDVDDGAVPAASAEAGSGA